MASPDAAATRLTADDTRQAMPARQTALIRERYPTPARTSRYSSTKVTLRLTRYPVILPLVTVTCCSLTQAPLILRTVLAAVLMPRLIASSKLRSDSALISMTLATDIASLLSGMVVGPPGLAPGTNTL